MFNNGTLIVYIEYDVSSISKWSWHPTLETLSVRDSFSLLVTYGCISIKTICGYNLETHVSLVITKFNVSWAKSDQNLCEGFMTILPYVWFCGGSLRKYQTIDKQWHYCISQGMWPSKYTMKSLFMTYFILPKVYYCPYLMNISNCNAHLKWRNLNLLYSFIQE